MSSGACWQCEHGYDLVEGHCEECREDDCEDNEDLELPECREKGIRQNSEMCSCDFYDMYDGASCRLCGEGCDDCSYGENGHYECLLCKTGYVMACGMPFC
jgi:hypothetical protein